MMMRFCDQLAVQVGWTEQSVSVMRSLFSSTIVKIGNGCKRWSSSYEREEWNTYLKVRRARSCATAHAQGWRNAAPSAQFANAIEEFMFYRPVTASLEPSDDPVPKVVTMPVSSLLPIVEQPVVPVNSAPPDRIIGIHIGAAVRTPMGAGRGGEGARRAGADHTHARRLAG